MSEPGRPLRSSEEADIGSSGPLPLAGRKVLVTGGTGFIGGRLVERLVVQHGADVRILTRAYASAARAARFPCELVLGDVAEEAAAREAVDRRDLVFHCAYGTEGSRRDQRRVNVGGTLNVLRAAHEAGVDRVVHVSTISVYGEDAEGDIDEGTPRRYSRNAYADTKLDAEKAALAFGARTGLPVSIVQPTMVYGPYSPAWTLRILDELRTGRVILVDGGHGHCHPVYVDDVVTLMLLASVDEKAVGEVFIASGEGPVTWKEFYGRFERMLGYGSTVEMSLDDSLALARRRPSRRSVLVEALDIFRSNEEVRERVVQSAEAAALIGILRRVVPESAWQRFVGGVVREAPGQATSTVGAERPIHVLPPPTLRWLTTRPRFRIDKARRLLGYEPRYDFETGMGLTEEWARWANLLS